MLSSKNSWKLSLLNSAHFLVYLITLIYTVCFLTKDFNKEVELLLLGNRGSVYRTIATIAGSLLGFTLAATSIVFGLLSNQELSKERFCLLIHSKHYPDLWTLFFRLIRYLGLLTICALICLIFNSDSASTTWLTIPLIHLIGMSILGVIRVILVLEKVIRTATAPQS